MNIQEAIKSGKPFKRKGQKKFYFWDNGGSKITCRYFLNKTNWFDIAPDFSIKEILANNWEIKEQ